MKIKEGFELRDVCGEQIIVAYGIKNIDFSQIISLNETAAFLWTKAIGHNFTTEELTKALCENYEVSQEEASSHVNEMIQEWNKLGFLE